MVNLLFPYFRISVVDNGSLRGLDERHGVFGVIEVRDPFVVFPVVSVLENLVKPVKSSVERLELESAHMN